MSGGGQIIKCPGCERLLIYGQTCVCGTNANTNKDPQPARGDGYCCDQCRAEERE